MFNKPVKLHEWQSARKAQPVVRVFDAPKKPEFVAPTSPEEAEERTLQLCSDIQRLQAELSAGKPVDMRGNVLHGDALYAWRADTIKLLAESNDEYRRLKSWSRSYVHGGNEWGLLKDIHGFLDALCEELPEDKADQADRLIDAIERRVPAAFLSRDRK